MRAALATASSCRQAAERAPSPSCPPALTPGCGRRCRPPCGSSRAPFRWRRLAACPCRAREAHESACDAAYEPTAARARCRAAATGPSCPPAWRPPPIPPTAGPDLVLPTTNSLVAREDEPIQLRQLLVSGELAAGVAVRLVPAVDGGGRGVRVAGGALRSALLAASPLPSPLSAPKLLLTCSSSSTSGRAPAPGARTGPHPCPPAASRAHSTAGGKQLAWVACGGRSWRFLPRHHACRAYRIHSPPTHPP